MSYKTNTAKQLKQITSDFYLQMGMMGTLQSNGLNMEDSFAPIWEEYWDKGIALYQEMTIQDQEISQQMIAHTLRNNLPKEQAEDSIEKVVNSLKGLKGHKCLDPKDSNYLSTLGITFDVLKQVA